MKTRIEFSDYSNLLHTAYPADFADNRRKANRKSAKISDICGKLQFIKGSYLDNHFRLIKLHLQQEDFKWRGLRPLLVLLILSSFLGDGYNGYAQASLEALISQTKVSSKTLLTARKFYEAEVMMARTNNSPDNPEVAYAYLWGTPNLIGNRIDFSVTQSFDFPTAYSSRSKLSKINREQASLRLKAAEQDVIVRAHQLWMMAVYFNKKNSLLKNRFDNAEMIASAFKRMLDEGEANQLQFNQAKLKVTALKNELSRLSINIVSNNALIRQMNGGDAFAINDSIFPKSQELVIDSLIELYQFGAQNAAFQSEVVRMEQQKEVVFNQKLPKLKAGYYQETILGTKLQGITAGITIPLWENANQVKSAKADLAYAKTDAARYWEQQELQVNQLYNQWIILKSQVNEIMELLSYSNNDELLLKALESGEISITQYYYESDFYFQNKFELLDFQRDLYLLEAELLRASY